MWSFWYLGSTDLTVCFRLQARQKVLTKIFCRDRKYCRKIKIIPYYPSSNHSGISNVIKHSAHLTSNRKIAVKSVPWLDASSDILRNLFPGMTSRRSMLHDFKVPIIVSHQCCKTLRMSETRKIPKTNVKFFGR